MVSNSGMIGAHHAGKPVVQKMLYREIVGGSTMRPSTMAVVPEMTPVSVRTLPNGVIRSLMPGAIHLCQ
jgi:hypothetical protein